jgi:hypothetical protein
MARARVVFPEIMSWFHGCAGLGCLAFALLGCEDDPQRMPNSTESMAGASSVAAEPRASLSGLWGMHTSDTDFVGVELLDGGSSFSGRACYDGWPDATSDPREMARSCANISEASIEGRHLRFTFEVTDFGGLRYASDAFIARDVQRMAGTVTSEIYGRTLRTRAVWLPMLAKEGRLTTDLMWPEQIDWTDADDGYELTLQEPAAGSELVLGKRYRIARYRQGLVGDLGAFWASELTFSTAVDGEVVLDVGPVAETEPNAPIRLALQFVGPQLQSVEAETASGTIYTLSASRPSLP